MRWWNTWQTHGKHAAQCLTQHEGSVTINSIVIPVWDHLVLPTQKASLPLVSEFSQCSHSLQDRLSPISSKTPGLSLFWVPEPTHTHRQSSPMGLYASLLSSHLIGSLLSPRACCQHGRKSIPGTSAGHSQVLGTKLWHLQCLLIKKAEAFRWLPEHLEWVRWENR